MNPVDQLLLQDESNHGVVSSSIPQPPSTTQQPTAVQQMHLPQHESALSLGEKQQKFFRQLFDHGKHLSRTTQNFDFPKFAKEELMKKYGSVEGPKAILAFQRVINKHRLARQQQQQQQQLQQQRQQQQQQQQALPSLQQQGLSMNPPSSAPQPFSNPHQQQYQLQPFPNQQHNPSTQQPSQQAPQHKSPPPATLSASPQTIASGSGDGADTNASDKKKAPIKKKKESAAPTAKAKAKGTEQRLLQKKTHGVESSGTLSEQQEQPPLKKAKKTPAPKKETVKGSKKKPAAASKSAGDQVSYSKAGTNGSTDSSGKEKEDENSLEKVNVEDLVPKDVSGLSTFVAEEVVSEESCAIEAKKTTETMREVFRNGEITMLSVLSRSKGGGDEFSSFSFDLPDDDTTSTDKKTVMDKVLLHKDKAQRLFQQVLSPQHMNYTKEAVSVLADGMQSHFRTLMESTIAAYHKRSNRKAMEHYKKTENILASTVEISNTSDSSVQTFHGGEVKPENRACYGLLFGPDIVTNVKSQCVNKKRNFEANLLKVEEHLKEHLVQEDELQKKGQKKTTKTTDKKVDFPENGDVSHEENMAWWKKEEMLSKQGALTWDQLALSRLKHKIAEKYELGPKARKKPRKDKGVDEKKLGQNSSQAMEIDDMSSHSAKTSFDIPSSQEHVDRSRENPFSDTDTEESGKILYRLTGDDARVALSKHISQRHLNGDKYCSSYGSVLKISNFMS